MSWDDLVSAANKSRTKARIHANTHLGQRCPKKKRLLKMSINSEDNQAEKSKAIALLAKANSPKSDKSETSDKVKKDWKMRWQKDK